VNDAPFHIVICTAAIILVRWPGADWRDLQDHFDAFVTSFGPLGSDDALDLIHGEWPDLARLKGDAIAEFFDSGAAQLTL
jgi:hypothetical protein